MRDRGYSFFAELKRRNVYKVAVAYAVIAWLLIQIATQVFPFFEIPNWAVRLVVLVLVAGFPVALVFSWAFEITPEGIVRETDVDSGKSITHHTGKKVVAITIVLAIVASGLLAFRLFGPKLLVPRHDASPARTEVATSIPEKSIAVLPFDSLSEDKSNAYFAEGVQEGVVVGHGLLNKLNQQEHFGRIHHRMHALLKGLHRVERGHIEAKENDDGMSAHAHRHSLQGEQAFVLLGRIGGEEFLDHHRLVGDLVELVEEFTVIDRGVDLETELIQGGARGFLKFRGAQPEQRRPIGCRKKFKFHRHSYFILSMAGGTGGLRLR